MPKKIELTDTIVEWMKENYGVLERRECAKHIGVSTTTIDRWAQQLALRKTRCHVQPVKYKKKKRPGVEVEAKGEDKGYCVDCEHYILGGHCGMTNRHTGALNEKKCFKRNK